MENNIIKLLQSLNLEDFNLGLELLKDKPLSFFKENMSSLIGSRYSLRVKCMNINSIPYKDNKLSEKISYWIGTLPDEDGNIGIFFDIKQ